MKKRIFDDDMNEMQDFTQWYALQDNEVREAKLRRLKGEEREWVREGVCEECGAFDILSRIRNTFLCNSCMNHLNGNNNKNNHRNNKR